MQSLIHDPVGIDLLAICDRCQRFHRYEAIAPDRILQSMVEWDSKHSIQHECRTHFITEKRHIPKGFDDRLYENIGKAPWWLDYQHNTDFKLAYVASAAITNAIQSLATSSTWLAGYESATYDNSSNKYLDVQLSGQTTVGTTPTINTRIEHHIVTTIADGTWPASGTNCFDGTTGTCTITSQGIKDGVCIPFAILNVDATTTDRVYPYIYRSVAALFGGIAPRQFGVFTTHNTGVNLNSTGGNQVLTATGIYMTGA